MSKQKIAYFIGALLLSCVTCSALAASTPDRCTRQCHLTVMLDWFINPDHAPLFVAEQQGYFKQYGLDVTFIPPADPTDTVKLVAAQKADIGITYEPQFLRQQQSQTLPLVSIGTLIEGPLDCFVVLKNSPIHAIADLKGKRIGYSSANTGGIILKTVLASAGLSLSDVTLVNVHYNLTQALLSGKVDIITGAMRNFEPYEFQLVHQPVRVFYPEENGMPYYDELIFITHTKNTHDPRIQLFLKAVQAGAIYLKNHPHSSWLLFAKNHPELHNPINEKAWFATIPRFTLRPQLVDQTQYEQFRNILQNEK